MGCFPIFPHSSLLVPMCGVMEVLVSEELIVQAQLWQLVIIIMVVVLFCGVVWFLGE